MPDKRPQIALTGQGRWCRVLAHALHHYSGIDVALAAFDRPRTGFSPRSWVRIARARLVVRVGFRPRSSSIRGRGFDALFALVTRLTRSRFGYYWIGTDVAQTIEEVAAGRLDPKRDPIITRAFHMAGSDQLAAELAEIGIRAHVAYFPAILALPQMVMALPSTFSVLTYVPDGRPDFYGGPQILDAARALPDVTFSIMGGTGSWATHVPENVRFLGWVEDTDAVFESASCLVRVVKHDAVGATVLEAMMYGLPVIYSEKIDHIIHVPYGDGAALISTVRDLRDAHHRGELRPDAAAAAWARHFSDPAARTHRIAALLSDAMTDVYVQPGGHRVHDAVSRWGSLLAALTAVIVLAPAYVLIALAVLLTMGRPVLFTQQRPGRYGRPITVHKFRTMRQAGDVPSDVHAVGTDSDRLTRLGRFLRATSLDEIPQFLDVIRGDMNLVGPRPLLMDYLDLYSPHHARRHEVRPGITGWAQVNGRNTLDWDSRLDLDVWYVDHRSIALDIRILLRSVMVALSRKGVSAEGVDTAVPFPGGAAGMPQPARTRLVMLVVNDVTRDARVRKEARSAANAGYDVVVLGIATLTAFEDEVWECDPGVFVHIRRISSPLRGFGNTFTRKMRNWRDLQRIGRDLAYVGIGERPHLVHANDLDSLGAAVTIKKALGCPVLYDSHELYVEMLKPRSDSLAERTTIALSKFLLRLTEARLLRHVDTTVSVNPFIAEELTKRYRIPPPEIVLNAPPATSVEPFVYEWPRPIFIYQGGFTRGRGLVELAQAFGATRAGTLVFMGFGALTAQLRQIAEAPETGGRVVVTDAVPQEQVIDAAAGADIGLIPYRPVGLNNLYASPNKLFDYLHAGIPIIGTDLPYVRQVLDTTGAGVTVPPHDVDALVSAMDALAADPHRLATMRAAARTAAPAYTWAQQEQALLGAYARLLRDEA